jgi:hypothetical protein
MTLADEIRNYAYRNYIIPARAKKAPTVTFSAGAIREALAIRGRMSIICDAIDAMKFEDQYVGRKGARARAKKLTAEQRSEIARKAAKASAKVRTKKAKGKRKKV